MHSVCLPLKLFKYMPDNDWTLANLRNRQLYFRSPDSQSDYFESRFIYRSQLTVEKLNSVLYSLSQLFEGRLESEIASASDSQKRHLLMSLLEVVEQQIFRKQYGVCSFSESEASNYLWDRFANGHKGICVAFNSVGRLLTVSEMLFQPISYTNNFENI